ncbi:MAG TPA: hypothetical protein DEQ38_08915 [Elusimicrobia bacterium]|nr:hypothetical protein [Elusimicrobiota bacterium]
MEVFSCFLRLSFPLPARQAVQGLAGRGLRLALERGL